VTDEQIKADLQALRRLRRERTNLDAVTQGSWQYAEPLDRLLDYIERLERENEAFRSECDTLRHQVITCGVAATHPDANLTRTGAYADKWNSRQAEEVRTLRAENETFRKDAELERAVQRAADVLPAGWQVSVFVERGAGWIELHNPDGYQITDLEISDMRLGEQVNAAIDAVLAQQAKESGNA
jgi:hypothetical protein